VQAYADDPSVSKTHYIDTFCRTRCAVKYHLVYTDDGEVRPLHHERAPSDLHEIIGYRLPDEVYFYLLTGMIGPQVRNAQERNWVSMRKFIARTNSNCLCHLWNDR
jgi:Temperature dependent protein affecting M2 dsRNA replication